MRCEIHRGWVYRRLKRGQVSLRTCQHIMEISEQMCQWVWLELCCVSQYIRLIGTLTPWPGLEQPHKMCFVVWECKLLMVDKLTITSQYKRKDMEPHQPKESSRLRGWKHTLSKTKEYLVYFTILPLNSVPVQLYQLIPLPSSFHRLRNKTTSTYGQTLLHW